MDSIKLYFLFIKARLMERLEYKTNFMIYIVPSVLKHIIEIIVLWFLMIAIVEINGWTFAELLLLNGVASLVFSSLFLFAGGIRNVQKYIETGDFDIILTRPVNPLIQVVTSDFWIDEIGGFIISVIKILLALALL
ncbi:MAG: ABC-2 family transporter protein, partial [Candidatus Micrarchaeota archaeon]|nr:ABC-2 family transporter protein [Candidatus Micrarchaeota archaeon]